MTQTHQIRLFGRRRPPSTVIIARGNDVRYFTIRPWLAAAAGTSLVVVTLAYFSATAYLVLRDDLIGATMAHHARLQQAYEDRISALRMQVDRITSRQLLDQQLVERKVGKLMERHERLTARHRLLGPVIERAGNLDGKVLPVPTPRPDVRADLRLDDITTGSTSAGAAGADRMFAAMDRSLRDIESEQVARVETLTEQAYRAVETIADALDSAGIDGHAQANVGGPLIFAESNTQFDERVRELDEVLDRLEEMKQTARRLPIANPLPGAVVTSNFGMRRDPIVRRRAYHSGVDFRAEPGAPIRAGGAGTVIKAGWNGGYGRMVEIDHGGGITSRYGHLSEILVKKGETVTGGTTIGRAGSSGRSTGPHLHYEVRRDGDAINPLEFISAGRRIVEYL